MIHNALRVCAASTGWRQSAPSSTSASYAVVNATAPPSARGHAQRERHRKASAFVYHRRDLIDRSGAGWFASTGPYAATMPMRGRIGSHEFYSESVKLLFRRKLRTPGLGRALRNAWSLVDPSRSKGTLFVCVLRTNLIGRALD